MNEKPKRSPAFQFYADDFLAGTSDMTAEEVGAYIRLLCHQWSKGGIPNDEERAGRMAGLMGSPSIRYVFAKFMLCEDGMLRNKRLEEVRRDQNEFKSKQAVSGKLGAEIRWKKCHSDSNPNGNPIAKPIATPLATPIANAWRNDSSPSPSPSPISKTDIRHDKLEEGAHEVTVRWIKPSISDLLEEASRIGLPKNEVEKFEAYYESNGWKVGKNKMKSWKHAMAGWKSRWQDEGLKGYGRQLFGTSTPDDAAF